MESPPNQSGARDLLQPQYAGLYEAQLERIWWVLIRTRQSMHIVSSVVKFPLGKFVKHDDIAFFWNLLVQDCGNAVVLSLHSLVNDNKKRTLSLRKLANSVSEWIEPKYLDWYRGRLKDGKFDSRLHDVAERLRNMRHSIAHIFLNHDGAPAKNARGISDSEIEDLYAATKAIFRIACLTEEFVIDTRDYSVGTASPRPIDKLLDLVAKDSYWVNQPETRKQWWQIDRQGMTDEELTDLNEWRTRFNLPPA
jgi:hypothetical protein